MRPDVVVLAPETIKQSLLLIEVSCRWASRLSLQCPRHPFVLSVLLRRGLGSINSGLMPSWIHQTESSDNLPSADQANGVPLSERIA